MKLIPCGTEVTIKINEAKGLIIAIEIRFTSVSYQVSYLQNGEYTTVWLSEELFTAGKHEKVKIGFNK